MNGFLPDCLARAHPHYAGDCSMRRRRSDHDIAMFDAVRADLGIAGNLGKPVHPYSRFSRSISSLRFKRHIRLIRSLLCLCRALQALQL